MIPYVSGGKTPDVGSRTYTEIMKEQYLRAEETEVCLTHMDILSSIWAIHIVKSPYSM